MILSLIHHLWPTRLWTHRRRQLLTSCGWKVGCEHAQCARWDFSACSPPWVLRVCIYCACSQHDGIRVRDRLTSVHHGFSAFPGNHSMAVAQSVHRKWGSQKVWSEDNFFSPMNQWNKTQMSKIIPKHKYFDTEASVLLVLNRDFI